MLQNVYTHAVSSSVSKRLEKERGGKGDSKTTMKKRRGVSMAAKGGWGWKERG